jgi:hypothetical protein
MASKRLLVVASSLLALALSAPAVVPGVHRSGRITFTLGRNQQKCFKEDIIEG